MKLNNRTTSESTAWLLLFASLISQPKSGQHVRAAAAPVANSEKAQQRAADFVFLDGKVLTVDPKNTVTQAVAVSSNRILAVGSNETIRQLIGERTKVILLDGKTVIPGLIATHCHAIGVGRNALRGPYVELTSISQIQEWIRNEAGQLPAGRWIRVPRADITRLKERRHPTPAELDEATTTHPVVFNAARKNVLNSLAFKLAGISRQTDSILGGKVLRDDAGNPRLIAGGDGFLSKFFAQQQFTQEETLTALKQVHSRYNRLGITSIIERAVNLEGYRIYHALHASNMLSVRTTLTIRQQFRSGGEVQAFTDKIGLKTGDGDDWIRVGPLKITVDGGIHWGTTFLREPYGQKRFDFYALNGVEDVDYRGNLRYSIEQMRQIFAEGHRLGWQMCTHVTGDAGVDRVLEALQQVHRNFPIHDRRFTLTHAYFPARDSIQKAKRLGVCVDTQCSLYYKDSDAIAEVYGREWAERFIGVGDWIRGGVPTAINGDHMIGLDPNRSMNAYNPFLMLYVAVSRKNQGGRIYGQQQRISREEALRCVTTSAAYLSFDEDKKGSLEVGKLADLAVLDRNYLTCAESDILTSKVLLTMIDGKIVYQQPEFGKD